MRHVSILIKPASSLCNMRCAYCFYADESEHRERKSLGVMTPETAERLIGAAFSAQEGKGSVQFSFQGGEPTLAGLEFFRRFAEMADRRNQGKVPVSWSMQTNGLNLDGNWVSFLRERRFLVGVSVDGDRALHDAFRPDAGGLGTYDRVTDGVRRLLENGVETNLLCVVHGRTAEKPKQVYRALRALKTGYLQFIPCLDPLDAPEGKGTGWSLSAEAYGRFLCGVFDDWYKDWKRGQYVSVRQFDDWVHMAMGLQPGACASCGRCGGYLVSEADGSLYPCDFYALDEWKLGTAEDDLNLLMRSERMQAFRARGAGKPAACGGCFCFPVCRGGCPRDWTEGERGQENRLCRAFQSFFRYAGDRIMEIARAEQALLYRGR